MRYSRLVLICSFLLICIVQIPASDEAGEIRLKSYIEQTQSAVTLKDIVYVDQLRDTADPVILKEDYKQRFQQIFQNTPAVVPIWQLRSLFADDLAGAEKESMKPATVIIGTPPIIYMPRGDESLIRKVICREALQLIWKALDESRKRIELHIDRIPPALSDAKLSSLELLENPGGTGRIRILCMGTKNGERIQAVVSGRIQLLDPIPVAGRNIEKDEIFSLAETDMLAGIENIGAYGIDISHTGRYQAVQDIAKGEYINRFNTRQKNDIEVGEKVFVYIREGNVSLQMKGVARENGKTGDVIAVRLQSGRIKDCRVEEKGEVILD